MHPPANLTLEQIKTLPVAEQLDVLASVWDDIAREQTPIPLTDAEKALLERRLAATDPGEEWDVVRERILNRLR